LFHNNVFPVFIKDVMLPARSYSATSTTTTSRNAEVSIRPGKTHDEIVRERTAVSHELIIGTVPHAQYVFYEAPADWVVVHDTGSRALYLYHVTNDLVVDRRQVIPEVFEFDWSPDEQSIAYRNNFELWVRNVRTGSEQLITRRSTGVAHVRWHPAPTCVQHATTTVASRMS